MQIKEVYNFKKINSIKLEKLTQFGKLTSIPSKLRRYFHINGVSCVDDIKSGVAKLKN